MTEKELRSHVSAVVGDFDNWPGTGCHYEEVRARVTEALRAAVREERERLDWLEQRPERLREVYWRMENEEETLRAAIDALKRLQAGGAE